MAETKIVAEIGGRVVSVLVGVGDPVEPGQEIAIVESMKMEIPVSAAVSGTVSVLKVNPEDMISEGDVLMLVRQ